MTDRLAGKVALVTGAARGQGEAITELFVREGARVLVTDILEAEAQAVVKRLGHAARWAPLDVADAEQWTSAVQACTDAFGQLDILVIQSSWYGSGRPS
jgi:3alpha(or 20beta)-hydroxysteroid dehydrogenase